MYVKLTPPFGRLGWAVGVEKEFYEHRFITEKDPDDLAGFYGSEE